MISIIVCARNEAADIGHVLRKARHHGDELLVVDGHSTDETVRIAEAYGARVVSDNHRGKGDAIRVGIREARGDVLVFIDADCSHDPDDIPLLLGPILAGNADHVTGSRVLGGPEELHGSFGKFCRRLGSDIITMGINLRYGVRLTDSQNGFRAIRASVARRLRLRENITTIEQEMIIKTLALGARMAEVPTMEYARRSGTSSIDVKRVAAWYVLTWLGYMVMNPPPRGVPRTTYRQFENPSPWWQAGEDDEDERPAPRVVNRQL
jgi:dolichol-phosphate mannosyltransferase